MYKRRHVASLARTGLLLLVPVCAVLLSAGASAEDTPAKQLKFESDIVPILRAYCWKCHGGEGRAAGLDMRTLPLLLAGGKSGAAIEKGSAAKSLLIEKLTSGKMPPGNELKPTEAHLATLRSWLDTGAAASYRGGSLSAEEAPPISDKDRQWWAFRKPIRVAQPVVRQRDPVRTPIDAFLLQQLEEKGLGYSPDAEAITLVRRLYLDLVGLPPSPEDIEAFLADQSPGAFAALVERLLASPRYGEKWGRHWLDAAGYVDTLGTDNDAGIIEERERGWKYRDYVVRAFNEDKPFDRFLLEQLAGDELVDWRAAPTFTPEIKELLIATGFLRQAADVTYAPELNTADIRHQVLFDTVQIFSSNVLGLTVHCAQCHTHKFDPIGHADYYRLAAFFAPSYDPQNWKHSKERFLVDVSATEKQTIDAHNADVDRRVAEFGKQIADARAPFERKLFEAKLSTLPEAIRGDTKAAVETPAERRSEVQKYLADKLGPLVKVTPPEVDQALDEPTRGKTAELNKQIAELNGAKRSYDKIQALWDLGAPPKSFLYRRGEFQTPGAELAAGVPAVLDDPAQPFMLPTPGGASSGYRTALAKWLTRVDHPLTARVFVNRIWQQYFGRGLVATPDNFGVSGAKPSHPELLDWLALEFVESGWSVKQLHRLIVNSTAYRQASGASDRVAGGGALATPQQDSGTPQRAFPTGESVDPDNRLLWRMPLRRLEAEIVRDAMLAASGALDTKAGGPPIAIKSNPDGSVEIDGAKLPSPSSQFRRSLYLLSRRNYHPTELAVFDQPAVAHNCTRRVNTAVVLQPLAMLNSPFAVSQGKRLAQRVTQTAGSEPERRVEAAFRFALCRPPTAEESTASREFLVRQTTRYIEQGKLAPETAAEAALANLCQMLMNTNEFLYVP